MRRQLENLKDATVVVVNPTHYAVALRYKKGETEAPIVVAKGIRKAALRIKEHAYDLRIAVRQDMPLARGLYKYGRIDQPIPPIFYQAVAVILAALYKQGFHASDIYTRPATAERRVRRGQGNLEHGERLMNKNGSTWDRMLRRGNLLFSIGMLAIVFILVLPLPTWMIDAPAQPEHRARGADHHADLEHQEADRLQRLPHACCSSSRSSASASTSPPRARS